MTDIAPEAKKEPAFMTCLNCGEEIVNKAWSFCSPRCAKWESNNPQWKDREATENTARERARTRHPELGICVMCDKPARDRHHIDGDVYNNEESNIMMLCRRDHMVVDGRLEELRERIIAQNKDHPRWQ